MKRDNIIRMVAGSLVLVSLVLSKTVHPNWIYLSAFVGLNLLQSSITGWCLLNDILHKYRIGKS